jgi:decaprenyl-phosphate phosphoribosyltransferase
MASKIKPILRLLRVRQYYKNVVLFIGMVFGGKLFDLNVYPHLLLGFILVSLMSSLNYIHNDIKDIESDKIHPEKKKKRPLANGDLSVGFAWFLYAIIATIEILGIIYYASIGNAFPIYLIFIFITGFLYNHLFKYHAFTDIISLSTIYVWRALAGCAIINIVISPWLFIIIFLVAMLLSTGKRMADLDLLGEQEAAKHKKIYDQYSKSLLQSLMTMNATSLFILYTLYCILGPKEENSIVPVDNQGMMIFSVPVAMYLIIRFLYLTIANPEIARNAEKVVRDKGMMIGAVLLILIITIVLYIEVGSWDFLHVDELFQ